MEDLSAIHDFPSPTNSMSYIYSDTELYLDSSSASSTTSPMESPYDLSALGIYDNSEKPDEPRDANQSEFQQPATKTAAKRKRENRYKNAPPSVLSRRRAQNRASQRAYRERKDQRIKDLEGLLSQTQQKNDMLSQAYETLQAEYIKLKGDQCPQNDYQRANLAYDPAVVGLLTSDLDFLLLDNQPLLF
ncbi:hypothetical protein F4775DRAFT_541062 [Biscogniauxia sp. FL1348]|nr:hypothetical protein F4775DRAFT_541062 [Biscogniauxia sp. FL1348]